MLTHFLEYALRRVISVVTLKGMSQRMQRSCRLVRSLLQSLACLEGSTAHYIDKLKVHKNSKQDMTTAHTI